MEKYLKEYSETIYPFHMPGHKLGKMQPLDGFSMYKIDVTEVEGTDNLHNPTGIIKEAQERAKEMYGSKESFFLVNGSSSGILSAISACCKQDGKILIARNSHKSVYHGILLNRLTPIYLYPEFIKEYNLLGGITPNQVKKMLEEYPDISCVLLTSPTFEGFVSDIKTIADIVHEAGKPLIVDEAHGAHFKFHSFFPKSALECGADIVIHSVHKTLPAFTQSALIHVGSERIDVEKLKEYLSIYQTTSPSYILMAGIDSCLRFIKEQGEAHFQRLIISINKFRDEVKHLEHINIVEKDLAGKYGIVDIDLSKLVFVAKEGTFSGKEIDKILRDNFQIQVEMATENSFLAITSIADDLLAFDYFFNALKEIDKNLYCINTKKSDIIVLSERIYDPYTVSQMEKETINLDESLRRVSGQFVTLYPPGIPILVPGEVVSIEILNKIDNYIRHGLTVIGLDNDIIKVVKRGI